MRAHPLHPALTRPDASGASLSRLAWLVGLMMLAFAALLGFETHKDAHDDQASQMQTALDLSAQALDHYFSQTEEDLHELGIDLLDDDALHDLDVARHWLRRYAALHPEVLVATLLDAKAQVLATSVSPEIGMLPSLAQDASYAPILARLDTASGLLLSRPLFGHVTKQWVFPLRYVMRDEAGKPVGILSLTVPVDMLQGFWRAAPVIPSASIGLLRDDGFMVSRYPMPQARKPSEMYGTASAGGLRTWLDEHGFPSRGYVDRLHEPNGMDYSSAFQRLEHYPVTLFVATPSDASMDAWWQRVRAPYALMLAFSLIGIAACRAASRRRRAWEAERLRNEAELRDSEHHQRTLLDYLLAGVVVYGPEGGMLEMNPEAMRVLGVQDAAVVANRYRAGDWTILDEAGNTLAKDDHPYQRVRRTCQPIRRIVIGVVQGAGADPIWIMCSFNPELGDDLRLKRVVATFVDITARRLAERTVELSARRFRLLYENSLDGVMRTRPSGEILSANAAACRIFGGDEATVKARGRAGTTDVTDPRVKPLIERRDRDGRAIGEIRMLRIDGTPFEAEVSSVIYLDDGEPYCTVSIRDCTDRQLRQSAVVAKELAERANEAKSRFITHMSHELRTPLHAILGFSDVLQRDARSPLTDAQRAQMQHIQGAGRHLLSMIDDVLDLSSVEAGVVKLAELPIDPAAILAQAVRDVQARADKAGVAVRLELPAAPLGHMRSDPTRFRQVLLNLLTNAIKYNRAGGTVHARMALEDGRLALSVADTGTGIDAAQLAALFQPFNRLGHEGSAIEGSGVGLVITKTLVELMGGTLAVESTPGVGTTFHVVLPHVPAEAPEPAPAPPAATEPVAPAAAAAPRVCNVLYIDDDPINRLLVRALLDMRKDVVLTLANDGLEGLAKAVHLVPDLVLTDMRLTTLHGPAVLRALREHPHLDGTRCVAVSANAMSEEIDAALAAGFDAYLTKPVPADVLFGEIDRTLQGARRPSTAG